MTFIKKELSKLLEDGYTAKDFADDLKAIGEKPKSTPNSLATAKAIALRKDKASGYKADKIVTGRKVTGKSVNTNDDPDHDEPESQQEPEKKYDASGLMAALGMSSHKVNPAHVKTIAGKAQSRGDEGDDEEMSDEKKPESTGELPHIKSARESQENATTTGAKEQAKKHFKLATKVAEMHGKGELSQHISDLNAKGYAKQASTIKDMAKQNADAGHDDWKQYQ